MRRWGRLGMGIVACLAVVLGGARAVAAPAVSLSVAVQPATVRGGGEVVYTITLANAGDADVQGLALRDTLPAGFSYKAGSTTLTLNGTTLPAVAPTLNGRTLTWSNLWLPAARPGSVFGLHTFVQDSCNNSYIDWQLDRVLETAGSGAYVKQLFYPVTASTVGAQGCWVHFVDAAYDRGLNPVVRLGGQTSGSGWIKPQADASGRYTSVAEAARRVVAGLPRRDGRFLYVEIWNEPNLNVEWSGAPNPREYGQLLVDVAAALRSLGDPRIVLLNGALAPGGDYNNLGFIDAMAQVPGAIDAFDVWATHPYPGNHPPEYNIHDHTAVYRDLTIDSYMLELEHLAAHGRSGLRVLLTETGYAMGSNDYGFEGFTQVGEWNRADYVARAFRDYWSRWPEVLGVCPYELVDPGRAWWIWDWMYPDGGHHAQYDSVKVLDKRPNPAASTLVLTFRAITGQQSGTFGSDLVAIANGVTLANATGVAPVSVWMPTATPTPTAAQPSATPTFGPSPTPTSTPICQDVLQNGGFETDAAWVPMGGVPGAFSTREARSDARSWRLGLDDGTNVYSYSSAEQELALSSEATSAHFSFWYKVVSSDPAGDRAYVLLRDGNQAYRTLGTLDLNAQGWTHLSFDTTADLGQAVAVRLTVVNDGTGGATAVYIDDAQWQTCGAAVSATPTATAGTTLTPTRTALPPASVTPSPSATPTVLPSPTPTRTPTALSTPEAPTPSASGCQEGLQDPGFEAGQGWTLLETAYRAAYIGEPVHGGAQALRLGISAGGDLASFSSAEQSVVIPANAGDVRLSFWMLPRTADRDGDVQYLLALNEGGGYGSLLWELTDAAGWQRREVSLNAYRGQRLTLRFGVRNDGDGALTSLIVDDVALAVCYGSTPTPYPTATPSPSAPPPAWSTAFYLPLTIRASSGGLATEAARALQPADPSLAYRAITADPESGRAFVLAEDGLWGIDPRGGEPARPLLAGRGYCALFFDAQERRLLVSGGAEGTVLAVDPERGGVVARIGGLLAPSGIGVYGERLFVAETGADRVVVLDRRTCGIMGSEPVGRAPYALAVDARRARVWVANAGGNTLTVLDAESGKPLGSVALDGLGHPQGIAIDEGRGRVYVTYLLSPLFHALAVIDADRLQVERVLRGDARQPLVGAYGVAVEPASGRIFLSDLQGLLALDPQTLQARVVAAGEGFAPPFGVLADAASGRVLAVDGRRSAVSVLAGR